MRIYYEFCCTSQTPCCWRDWLRPNNFTGNVTIIQCVPLATELGWLADGCSVSQ